MRGLTLSCSSYIASVNALAMPQNVANARAPRTCLGLAEEPQPTAGNSAGIKFGARPMMLLVRLEEIGNMLAVGNILK